MASLSVKSGRYLLSLAFMHKTALYHPNPMGKFSKFSVRVGRDPNVEVDHIRKICPSMRFFDMIRPSLNMRLFASNKHRLDTKIPPIVNTYSCN